MLPDRILNEIKKQVELHFGDDNPKLIKAAHTLADAGWVWDQMRPLLSDVYNAGVDSVESQDGCGYGC